MYWLTSDYQTTPRMFPSGFVLSQGINPAADDFCDLWTTSLWNYWTGLESNGCSRPTCNISHNCRSGPRARTQLSPGPILSQHQTRRYYLTAGPFPEPVLRDATFAGEILNTTGEIDIVLQLCTAHQESQRCPAQCCCATLEQTRSVPACWTLLSPSRGQERRSAAHSSSSVAATATSQRGRELHLCTHNRCVFFS